MDGVEDLNTSCMKPLSIKYIIGTLLLLSFNAVQAGSCLQCEVIAIGAGRDFDQECRSNACVLIRLQDKVGQLSRSACSVTGNWHYVLDTSTDHGKARLEILREALDDRRKVDIAGNDSCHIYSSRNIEDLAQVTFSKIDNNETKQPHGGW